jgi:hypothetical protein
VPFAITGSLSADIVTDAILRSFSGYPARDATPHAEPSNADPLESAAA